MADQRRREKMFTTKSMKHHKGKDIRNSTNFYFITDRYGNCQSGAKCILEECNNSQTPGAGEQTELKSLNLIIFRNEYPE
jgi:hypothetical protein